VSMAEAASSRFDRQASDPMDEPAERERVLFEASPLPLWVVDLETRRILQVNAAACRAYAYTREEFLTLTQADFLPFDEMAGPPCPSNGAVADIFASGRWRHRVMNGSTIHVEVTATDLAFLGRPCRFVCPNDVTQRVRTEAALRERERALRRAQGLAQLAHNVTGPGGVFESWSETLPRLIGMTDAEMPKTARGWLPLVHPGDRERFRAACIEAGMLGVRRDIEYRLLRADGEVIHIQEVIEPIEEYGRPSRGRWFCTLQDISELKRAEDLVRRANEALEERVRERTMQLEVSNCELAFAMAAAERANRSKSEFLSNMSHELRTPLNAIVGFGQLLARPGVMERDAAQRAGFVEHIVDAGRHLLTLINEILNLSQIEAGKVEVNIERVALGPLLAECDAMVDPMADRRAIRMRFPPRCDVHLQADRMRLKQVLLNLVSNAIKYNRADGSVSVEFEVVDDRVRIDVRDTGIGLAPDQVAALFQAFNRLGQNGGAEEGTGLGLVVTKRLVELMGGEIGVASTPGVGSVFFVEFPLAPPQAVRVDAGFEPADAAWLPAPANPFAEFDRLRFEETGLGELEATILCVDDDVASLRLLQQVLATLPDVHLLTASNGRLGVEMALAHSPTLIVMDNNMPEMNGREALQRLGADPRTSGIPVIALSANAMPEAAAASLAVGAFRYLTKPFDVGALLEAVSEALREARARAPG